MLHSKHYRWLAALALVWVCFASAVLAQTGAPMSGNGLVIVMKMDGAIMPPTKDYFRRALRRAERERATCLLVEMDTPGGLGSTMREIAQDILTSKVPVVVYVAPIGARAGSAGAVIGLSAHVLAMAPNTNIGAAHPVSSGGDDIQKDMRDKVVNDMAAFVRSVAEKRGKDKQWAEDIIRKSVSSSDSEALKLKVADYVAESRADLFSQMNGRKVHTAGGEKTLNTLYARTEEENATWGEDFLQFLFNPNVTLILWILAIYGLIAEFNHPGAILPGVVGVIALVLALFSMSVLSASGTGIALLVLSVILFGFDIYATSHGVLTVGGIVAFVAGALMLFNPAVIGVQLSMSVVISTALVTTLFFGYIVAAAVRSRRMPLVEGPETLIGREAEARSAINPTGKVFTDGTFWNAVNSGIEPIEKGDKIVIEGRDGLTLKVRRAEPAPAEPIWSHNTE